MMWILVGIGYVLILVWMWSLLAVSAEADRRQEQSFAEWKRQKEAQQ